MEVAAAYRLTEKQNPEKKSQKKKKNHIMSCVPFVAANFKCITTKFPFVNLRKLLNLPGIFSI